MWSIQFGVLVPASMLQHSPFTAMILRDYFCLGIVMSVYEKLKALNIQLPAVAAPAVAYVMHAQTGNTVLGKCFR